uniref:Uncharacterized protein n=1 Tax=Oryza meridionalis TaxID=40149 RepID=A0A0E0F6Y1_9ORYZ
MPDLLHYPEYKDDCGVFAPILNSECPTCHTHCASRRSLRNDPSFDALILAMYPNFDKKDEEELAFSVEKSGNKKESIDEAFRRQREPLGKKQSTTKAIGSSRSEREGELVLICQLTLVVRIGKKMTMMAAKSGL